MMSFTECGKSPRKINVLESAPLIMTGGYNSSRGDFPWIAAISTPLDEGRWTHICGGTLISPNIVLTGNSSGQTTQWYY